MERRERAADTTEGGGGRPPRAVTSRRENHSGTEAKSEFKLTILLEKAHQWRTRDVIPPRGSREVPMGHNSVCFTSADIALCP